MLNRLELIGNLTRTPELRRTKNGVPYCFIRLATNEYRAGKVQRTDYHSVVMWHAMAERAVERMAKGNRVFIEARVEQDSVPQQTGTSRNHTRLVATRFRLLERASVRTGSHHVHGKATDSVHELD